MFLDLKAFMDCRAYCTATSYQLKILYDNLKGSFKPTLFRDVIHIPVQEKEIRGDVFYFPYGVTVCWGLSQESCYAYLDKVKDFEHQPLEEIETDEFTFTIGDTSKIVEDEIILPNDDVLVHLAISHGLAQSVKLGAFENALRRTFNQQNIFLKI